MDPSQWNKALPAPPRYYAEPEGFFFPKEIWNFLAEREIVTGNPHGRYLDKLEPDVAELLRQNDLVVLTGAADRISILTQILHLRIHQQLRESVKQNGSKESSLLSIQLAKRTKALFEFKQSQEKHGELGGFSLSDGDNPSESRFGYKAASFEAAATEIRLVALITGESLDIYKLLYEKRFELGLPGLNTMLRLGVAMEVISREMAEDLVAIATDANDWDDAAIIHKEPKRFPQLLQQRAEDYRTAVDKDFITPWMAFRAWLSTEFANMLPADKLSTAEEIELRLFLPRLSSVTSLLPNVSEVIQPPFIEPAQQRGLQDLTREEKVSLLQNLTTYELLLTLEQAGKLAEWEKAELGRLQRELAGRRLRHREAEFFPLVKAWTGPVSFTYSDKDKLIQVNLPRNRAETDSENWFIAFAEHGGVMIMPIHDNGPSYRDALVGKPYLDLALRIGESLPTEDRIRCFGNEMVFIDPPKRFRDVPGYGFKVKWLNEVVYFVAFLPIPGPYSRLRLNPITAMPERVDYFPQRYYLIRRITSDREIHEMEYNDYGIELSRAVYANRNDWRASLDVEPVKTGLLRTAKHKHSVFSEDPLKRTMEREWIEIATQERHSETIRAFQEEGR